MNDLKFFTIPHSNFTATKAYKDIKNFIFEIDNFIKSTNEFSVISNNDTLRKIEEIILKTELSTKVGRFANPAMVSVLEEIESTFENEYLKNAFGNKIRMDYGTGHELNYLCYLYVLYKYKQIELNEIFQYISEYSRIVRFFIKKFNVEAAGSRGVWSIDDYLLLPYLFGSSENFYQAYPIDLIPSGLFKEAQKNNPSIKLKTLCRMSWKKINMELIKFYDEEVLSKFVVTQHFIYSNLLSNDPS